MVVVVVVVDAIQCRSVALNCILDYPLHYYVCRMQKHEFLLVSDERYGMASWTCPPNRLQTLSLYFTPNNTTNDSHPTVEVYKQRIYSWLYLAKEVIALIFECVRSFQSSSSAVAAAAAVIVFVAAHILWMPTLKLTKIKDDNCGSR